MSPSDSAKALSSSSSSHVSAQSLITSELILHHLVERYFLPLPSSHQKQCGFDALHIHIRNNRKFNHSFRFNKVATMINSNLSDNERWIFRAYFSSINFKTLIYKYFPVSAQNIMNVVMV